MHGHMRGNPYVDCGIGIGQSGTQLDIRQLRGMSTCERPATIWWPTLQ